MSVRTTSAVLAAALFAACAPPPSSEVFLRSDGTGEYSFPADLSDTLSTYDISFYTVIDRPALSGRDTLVSFPMHVVWRSPSGRFFSETVYYPADKSRVLYRKGLVPGEAGEWTVTVSMDPEPQGMRGLGLEIDKNAMSL